MAFYRCGGNRPTGNAVEADVLEKKTFSNENGTDKIGTMPNATGDITITTGKKAITDGTVIPKGYHDGTKKVKVSAEKKTYQADRVGVLGYDYTGDVKLPSSITINPPKVFSGGCNIKIRANEIDIYDSEYLSKTIKSDEYIKFVNTVGIPNSNSGTYTFPEWLSLLIPELANGYVETSTIASKTYNYGDVFWYRPMGSEVAGRIIVDRVQEGTQLQNGNNFIVIPAYQSYHNDGRSYDLGANNSIRYVNATKVYSNGVDDTLTSISTTGSSAWGSNLNERIEYTCTRRGLYLVIAFALNGDMLDDSLVVWSDDGIVGGWTDRVEHMWGTDDSGGARVIIKQVADCSDGTKIHCRSTSSNCSQIKIISIST